MELIIISKLLIMFQKYVWFLYVAAVISSDGDEISPDEHENHLIRRHALLLHEQREHLRN